MPPRYWVTSRDHGEQYVSQGTDAATDAYLMVWEQGGAVRVEGAMSPGLVQRLLGSLATQAVADRLPGFLRRKG